VSIRVCTVKINTRNYCITVNVTINLSANTGQIYLHDIYVLSVLFIVGKHIPADAFIVD